MEGPTEAPPLNNVDTQSESICLHQYELLGKEGGSGGSTIFFFFTAVRKCNIGCFDSLSKVL